MRLGISTKTCLIVAISLAGIIFVLSVIPFVPRDGTGLGVNLGYAGHFIAYGLLAALLFLSSKKQKIYYPIIISFTYGAVLEVVQYFIKYRTCSGWDAVVNGVGALCGLLVANTKYVKDMVGQ